MSEAENGAKMEMGKFISEVLQNVLEGVLLAQGASVPCSLPDGVEFVFGLANGDVTFTVPLSNMMFDRGTLVTYSHGSIAKN
jgi:hypothetical protein